MYCCLRLIGDRRDKNPHVQEEEEEQDRGRVIKFLLAVCAARVACDSSVMFPRGGKMRANDYVVAGNYECPREKQSRRVYRC